MSDCDQELCQYWGGDGNVCHCALFSIEPGEGAREARRWSGEADGDE